MNIETHLYLIDTVAIWLQPLWFSQHLFSDQKFLPRYKMLYVSWWRQEQQLITSVSAESPDNCHQHIRL